MERFWNKVQLNTFASDMGPQGGCWWWTAGKNSKGYGCFSLNSTMVLAHRYSYHLIHPDFSIDSVNRNDQLDHICRNRLCVNPNHLDRVTNRENTTRGKVSKLKENKSSKYIGVSWDSWAKKWKSSIKFNGKSEHLGNFNSEEEASEAYRSRLNESGV